MYPDTDTPPLPLSDTLVAEVSAQRGEAPWSRQARYEALGIEPAMAGRLAGAPWAGLFDQVAPAAGVAARRLAGALEKRIPFHTRRTGDGLPSPEQIVPLVRALERGDVRPEAMVPALDDLLANPARAAAEVVAAYASRTADELDLEARINDVVARRHLVTSGDPEAALRWAMGEVMRPLHGRVDAARVERRVAEALRAPVLETLEVES
jgi:Glu-tRNA(Gln) amidotransferase subunit E-like FAD-binding protein